MSQPRDYTRQFNFKDYQATTPADPLPGTQVDAELNAVKLTLDDLNTNIAKVPVSYTHLTLPTTPYV